MVSVVAVDKYGARSDLAFVPTVWLALDGVISAPLAPRIKTAQSALDDGKGWQFEFLVNGGLLTDQIAGYRIYHSENPSDTAPAYYTTKTQPPTNVGSIIVQEVTGDLLWYWVSAISTSGLESTLVAVPFQYVDPGSPPPSLTAVTTTQTYKPSTSLNGWAANAHVGYFETQDLTSGSANFGLGSQVVGAYTSPANAFDGNQSTAANYAGTHHAGYAGVVYTFNGNTLPAGATVTGVTLSVVSDVQGTSGICGEASVYYSTNGGSTWTSLYVWDAHNTGRGARLKQTDKVTLSTSVSLPSLQVMACSHSHDDLAHNVYEVSLDVTVSSYAGPETVTGVKASLVSNNVVISWNGLVPLTRSDLLGYEVYRSNHGAGYTLSHKQATITPTGASSYSWTDTQAHDGSFDYWVIAHSNAGYSPASSVATIYSGGSVLYSTGVTAEDLRPAEGGAEKTTGKSLDVLTDGSTYKRVAANHVAAGGALQYTTGETMQSLKPAEGGAEKTTGKALSVLTGRTADNITYTAGGTVDSLKPGEAGAEKTTGKSLSVLIDRHLGNIADDSASGRYSVASIDANRKALIDFAQAHSGKILDNIGEGTTYKRVSASHVAAGGILQYSAGGTLDSLKPAEGGAQVFSGKSLSLLADRHLGNITDGGGRYAAGETGANNTLGHITTSIGTYPFPTQSIPTGGTQAITGAAWTSVTGPTTGDVFNIWCNINATCTSSTTLYLRISVQVDGVDYKVNGNLLAAYLSFLGNTYTTSFPFYASVTGLSANTSHTIQLIGYNSTAGSINIQNTCVAICQHIF
jgi:hypothetical protein